MKQKFDLRLTVKGDSERTKALTIAAKMTGVISVMIGGRDKNILTVIGNEVDIVGLTRSLGKKLGSATVVSVLPLNMNGGYDQEEAEASMRYYGGQSNTNYNYGGYNYRQQPKYSHYYNNPPVTQYPPRDHQYYYLCEKPDDEYSSCSIM